MYGTVDLIANWLVLPALTYVFAWFVWTCSINSTLIHYRARTIMYATGWAAALFFPMDLYTYLHDGEYFMSALAFYNTCWVNISVYKMYVHNDDDHWFKGRGKKIARWAKKNLSFHIRVPQPATSGI